MNHLILLSARAKFEFAPAFIQLFNFLCSPMSNLYTKTYGSPSNPAILFIHGLGSSSIYFESVIEISNLSENYYLITYDGPGHGQSPLSTNSVTVESLVELAETILAEKGIKQLFGLVGHSLGGLMSLNLAGKLGNRLEKLCEWRF